jgi:hypothetical protein
MKDILAKLDELTKRKKLTESQNVSEQLDRDKVKEAEWDYDPFKDGSARDYGHEGDTEDYIIKLWNQGMDVKEIAAQLDADLQLVKDTVDKYEASDSYDDEPDIDDPAHAAEGYGPQYESKKSLKDYINEASVEHDKNKEVEEAVRLGFVRDKEFTRPTNPSHRRELANKAKEIRGTARFLKKKGEEMRAQYDDPESLGPAVVLPQAGLASIAKSPDAPFKNVAVSVTGPSKREHPLYKPKVLGAKAGKMMGEAEQIQIKPASQKTQVITQGNKTLGTVTNPALADQIKRAIGKGEMSLAGGQLGEADDHSSLEPVMSFQTRDDDESMDYHRMADVYKQGEDYVVMFKTQAPGMRAPSPLRTTDISQAEKAARKYTGNDKMNEAKKVKNPYAVGMAVAKKAAGITAKHAEDLPKKVIKKAHKIAKEIKEAEIPGSQVDLGAGLGAGRSRSVLESPMDEPVIINTPEGIKYVQMAAAKGAIRLEKLGMRHSKIGSVKNAWAKHLGMRPRATHDEVIAELEKRMQKIKDNLSETKISKAVKAGKKVAKDIAYDEMKDKAKKKKKVKESMNPQLKAAYQEGYAHGLREQSCRVKHYENMEEAKKYYEGYKCGLDECYGMMPVQGLVVGESDTYMDEMSMPATVPGMASQAMGENLSQVGISDDLAAKKITDKLKGTPGITANNIDRHVSRYLGMVGKQPTDLKHLSVLVFNNLEALGLAESEYGTLDEMMLHDDELNEMMADLEEMSRGEYISHMDKKAERAGKNKFNAFGQEFKTDEVDEGWSMEEDSNDMFESLDKQLNDLLNEGLSVSVSTGQPGMQGDSVSVNATDDDAAQLLDFVKKVGLGGLSAEEKHEEPAVAVVHSDYGAPSHQPDDRTSMLALMKKMNGEDYEQESDEGSCGCEAVSEMETDDQREFQVAEGDGEGNIEADAQGAEIDSALALNMKEGIFGFEDKIYVDKNNVVHIPDYTQLINQANMEVGASATARFLPDRIETSEKTNYLDILSKIINQLGFDSPIEKEDDGNVGVHLYFPPGVDVNRLVKLLNGIMEKGISSTTAITEWANDAGKKGTDEAFEADIDFMTNVITAGLNGRKSTGQTTVPVIAGQTARTGADSFHESKGSIAAWQKLCGIR